MKSRLLAILLTGLIVTAGLGIVYVASIPRLVEVFPAAEATAIPAFEPIRITFSRSMQPDSVSQRLTINPARSGQFSWEGDTLIFTPDQPWPNNQVVQVQLAPGARASGFLSFSIGEKQSWSFRVGPPLLVYLYPSNGPADIYSLDPQTQKSKRLTRGTGEVLDFSLSPTDRFIFYSANQGNNGSAIYRLNRLSGEVQLVLKCPQAICHNAQVSPGGDYLAYERAGFSTGVEPSQSQVWLLPLAGGENSVQVESADSAPAPILAADPSHKTQDPVWSPSGELTFYDANLSTFVIQDPISGTKTQFTNQTGQPGSWSPDGKIFIVNEFFANQINDPNTLPNLNPLPFSSLMEFDRQDGQLRDLTSGDDLEDTFPAFSPDGSYLAFARRYLDVTHWTPGRQLWIMRPDGSQAQALTQEPQFNHYDFAWSPDSRQLAYVRFNQTILTDPPEIWVIDLETNQSSQLVTGGFSPQWIP